MTSLAVTTTTDYRGQTLEDIDAIEFADGFEFVVGRFAAAQFGAGLIAANVTLAGGSLGDRIEIFLDALNQFDASAFQFAAGTSVLPYIFGTAAADDIAGTSRNDRIDGSGGRDAINGGAGNDIVVGGGGDDRLSGGGGWDELNGGLGADRLRGTKGPDSFLFTAIEESPPDAPDRIFNFRHRDVISLADIGANFILTHTGEFSGYEGELIHYFDGEFFVLAADIEGDLIADMIIKIKGNSELHIEV